MESSDSVLGREYTESYNSNICRIGMKNIPFKANRPSLWFSILEGHFALANITVDTTKFYYAISLIGPQYNIEVADIIESPPAPDKYAKLKTELIKRLSASKERNEKQVMDHDELGDRKPSQLLRHLQSLADPNMSEDFLRTVWTSRLPTSVQSIIASQIQSPLANLAELADRIQDILPTSPHVASTSASTSLQLRSDEKIDMMAKQIEKLTQQVNAQTMSNRQNT